MTKTRIKTLLYIVAGIVATAIIWHYTENVLDNIDGE